MYTVGTRVCPLVGSPEGKTVCAGPDDFQKPKATTRYFFGSTSRVRKRVGR